MTTVIVDASVAIKWAVQEILSEQAIFVLSRARLIAPDLLIAECANILWKKAARNQLSRETAILAASAIEHTEIELVPMRLLMAGAVELAIDLMHPAYDCLYLALALQRQTPFVTSDVRLLKKIMQDGGDRFDGLLTPLAEAPAALEGSD